MQNYLANKARYLGVGFTEAGMATMDRDITTISRSARWLCIRRTRQVVFSTDATAGAHGRNAEEFIGRVEHCGQSPMEALVSAKVAAEALGMATGWVAAPAMRPTSSRWRVIPRGSDGGAPRVFVMRGGVIYKSVGAKPK